MSSNLWQKIENRHNNKGLSRVNNNNSGLYEAIMKENNNNGGQILGDTQGVVDGINGFAKLANTLGDKSGTGTGWGSIGQEAGSILGGSGGGLISATSSYGDGSSWGSIFNNSFDTAGSSALDSSENFSNFMGGSSGGSWASNAPWGAIAGVAKGGYNAISGKDDKDYSDVEESVIYPLQGAATGYQLGGPWGAAGGALYGLGYSLKDELGLKDSNLLTQVLFPIGMGDGGGLRIGGESILDLG